MSSDRFFVLDGRPTVRVERHYAHPVERVWRAVTTPEHLGQWFPSPVELDLRVGGAMRFSAFDDEVDGAGTVEVVDAPRLLSFSWGRERVTLELTAERDGTTLALTHTFDDRYGAPSIATGWELSLAALTSVLAGEPLPPPDRGIARHEELVHEFGLDQPEVTESEGGWTVRFERQLTCPAWVAWDLWFGKDRDTGEQRTAPAVGEPLTPYMAPDLVIGTMTQVDLHRVLEFDVAPTGGPGERVRVELTDGMGHGARITLTVIGRDPAEREAAAELWGTGAIGHLAAMGAEWAMAQPAEA